MTSRSRESRRPPRDAAIWRGTPGTAAPPTVELDQARESGRMFVSWRVISGLMVVALSLLLVLFFFAEQFYVHDIAVTGLDTMTHAEILAIASVDAVHVFWIDPAEVRASLLRSPTIAEAQVAVGWPPSMVTIAIREREPALVWEQSGIAVWVDVNGRVMRQREARGDLLRIAADPLLEGPPGASVDSAAVAGALQVRQILPDRAILRYHPDKGLGFIDPDGWQVWLGTGTGMPEKLAIYDAIAADVRGRGVFPTEVNVSDPDNPFWCCRPTGTTP